MLIPYNTDAPIYHWPFATVALIVINISIYLVALHTGGEGLEPYILYHGDGLHPVQWVTSNFLHADFLHLFGNMFFLWGFGIVVEGKLGWWKFLLVFFAIGIVQCAVEQVLMLGYSGEMSGSLGASSIIFGLMVMALIWAPKNEMSCILFLGIFIGNLEISILMFGLIYIGWDLLLSGLSGFSMSTATLHMSGAMLGAIAGVALFKLKVVDCEGWDVFALWRGDVGAGLEHKRVIEPEQEVESTDVVESNAELSIKARQRFRRCLREGDVETALAIRQKMIEAGQPLSLDQAELMAVIKLLHSKKQWPKSVPFMGTFLRNFSDPSHQIRLRLAQILIQVENRPGKAIEVLGKIEPGTLAPKQEETRRKLLAAARTRLDDGELELDGAEEEDW